MVGIHRAWTIAAVVCMATALAGCGGDFPGTRAADLAAPSAALANEANAPQATGNTATDGLNWVNFRRQQLGLRPLIRSSLIDSAAQGHSTYQKINNVISHEQTSGKPGFTGATLADRLQAVGYALKVPYAYGEVISASVDPSGFNAVEGLTTAIYHRFVMFEPRFREAGAGSAGAAGGYQYLTLNFGTSGGLGPGLGTGRFINYPMADQQNIPTTFFSDYETPDPVEGRNEVGYPVSVHADINSSIAVQSFSVAPHGGPALPVKLLSHATDTQTAQSVAAIVPLAALVPKTTYDVQFIGAVDGVPVARSWSFVTR